MINAIIFWCLIVGIFMMSLSMHHMKLEKNDFKASDMMGCFLVCYIFLVGAVTVLCFLFFGIKNLINHL